MRERMILQAFYPIFIPSGDSGPMSEHDAKTLIGVFVVLNILWLISWLVTLARYVHYKISTSSYWSSRLDVIGGAPALFDFFMLFAWVVIVVFGLGEIMANAL